ncbi:MAG: helix-turn-helix domain-containing protein [Burkholderiales bacterium]
MENVAKKMVALGEAEEAVADLGWNPGDGHRAAISHETVSLKDAARAASRQAERELILQVLTRVRWNRKRAARDLQISYKALLYKLKQIGLDGSGPA